MPAKSKVKIPLASGAYLTDVGYSVHLSTKERHKKLITAVNTYSYKSIVLRLNAVANRLHNVAPETTKRLRSDMAFLKKKFRS